jgi:disease resistance protein RPM1
MGMYLEKEVVVAQCQKTQSQNQQNLSVKNPKHQAGIDSHELGSMHAALRRVAEVPRNQLDEEVRLWAGDVRELSYDMEDIVDSLLVRVKSSDTDADMDGLQGAR